MEKRISNKKSSSSSSSFRLCFDSVVLGNNKGLVVGEEREPLLPPPPPSEVEEKEVKPVLSPATNMMTMSSDDKDKEDVVGSFRRKNKLCRRSFLRYVKAVVFETSLMKKIRDKRLRKGLSKPKSKPTNNIPSSTYSEDSTSTSTSAFSSCLCANSATNSSSALSTTATTTTMSSRCSSTSLSWNLRPWSSETMENDGKEKVGNCSGSKGCNGFNVGFCLFLISLWVLIIWGKVFAIFCTSTWLFFVYPWSYAKLAPSENIAVDHHSPRIFDSESYKKKVIMEGLLQRNHSRNPFRESMKCDT